MTRDDFVKAIEANPNDEYVRATFGDWLEENGEPEEADRQRSWVDSRNWLVEVCRRSDDGVDWLALVEMARDAVDYAERSRLRFGDVEPWFSIQFGNAESLQEEIYMNGAEFWRHWSIVTGIPVPPDIADRASYSCSC